VCLLMVKEVFFNFNQILFYRANLKANFRMDQAGYSGTPLIKKLGIKDHFVVKLVNEPDHYFDLIQKLPDELTIPNDASAKKDFIHFFTTVKTELESLLPEVKNELKPAGMIWVSWPKKSSKVETDITEDVIRNFALSIGLVDIKVCAVDQVWSGLKLVIPVKDRK